MEVIDVDSKPVVICQDESPEEVFSIDWRPASDLLWENESRKYTFLKYLIKYGTRELPSFKKRLKLVKKLLRNLDGEKDDGENLLDSLSCSAKEKIGNIKSLFAAMSSHVTMATVKLNQPGLHKFFAEGLGKELLASLGRKHSCCVETVTETPVIVLGDEIQSSDLSDVGEVLNRMVSPLPERWNADCREKVWSLDDVEEVIGGSNQQEKSVAKNDNDGIPPVSLDETSTLNSPINTTVETGEPAVPMEQDNSLGSTFIKNTEIQFCLGDLTKQLTDAILILNKDNLDLFKGGQLNAQIAIAAGHLLKTECKRIVKEKGAQLPGEAVITGSGNLPCRHIVHVIVYPGTPQILDLQLGVKKGLQLADARGLVSIALPAIGSGSMRLPLTDSARVLSGGILSFLERPPQSLREIQIVFLLEDTLRACSAEMKREFVPIVTLEEYSPLSSSNLLHDDFKCAPLSQPDQDMCNEDNEQIVKSPPPSPTQFRVFGKDRQSIKNTISSMQQAFAKHSTSHGITHKMVPQIAQECWSSLTKVATQHEVELTLNASKSGITVHGNPNDVSVVVNRLWREITRLTELQNNKERRKLLAQYVCWYFIILDKEICINEYISASLEDLYRRKFREARLFVKECEFRVDFNGMNVLSSRSCNPPLRLSRRMISESGTVTPDCWNPQPCFPDGGPVSVLMVKLLASEWEYKHVADKFFHTGGHGNILSIERVQNLCLYTQYTTYKQEVEKNNFRLGFNNQNERQLFHGTKGCNVRAINLQGFNRNFCGMNGAVFGNGVYFASDALYSMKYAIPDSTNVCHMYLARVVVGFFAQGQRGLRVPPPLRSDVPEVLFDSVVDNVGNPRVFVAFRDFQCYPEYLITFKTTA